MKGCLAVFAWLNFSLKVLRYAESVAMSWLKVTSKPSRGMQQSQIFGISIVSGSRGEKIIYPNIKEEGS